MHSLVFESRSDLTRSCWKILVRLEMCDVTVGRPASPKFMDVRRAERRCLPTHPLFNKTYLYAPLVAALLSTVVRTPWCTAVVVHQ